MSRFEIVLLWIAYLTWVISVGGLLIWLGKQVKGKVHKKAKPVQPRIEVYGKNYKKINNASKFNRVG